MANVNVIKTIGPDGYWQELERAYLKTADELCPVTQFNIKKDRPHYFNDDICRLVKQRDLFKRARKEKDHALWKKKQLKREKK